MASSSGSSSHSTGAAAIFTPISAPILKSVDPIDVAAFLKERERDEVEITAKKGELPSLSMLPYSASIDRSLLKSLFFMGKFDTIAPKVTEAKDLSDTHIQMYITSIVSSTTREGVDPSVIDQALASLEIPTTIKDPAARITQYCADSFERLEAIGYGDFRDTNSKFTVKLMLRKFSPKVLKQEMTRRVQYDDYLEKNVKLFVKTLVQEAVKCNTYTPIEENPDKHNASKKGDHQHKAGSSRNNDRSKSSKEPPLCLLEEHAQKGIRHFMRDCTACSQKQKDKLLEEYYKKKRRQAGSARRTADTNIVDESFNSVNFGAVFEEKWRGTICTDIGADDNIIDFSTIAQINSAGVVCDPKPLLRPRDFRMAALLEDGTQAVIKCTHTLTMNIELNIRHGTALMLRGVKWLVTNQEVGEPLIGRPLLEKLGFHTRDILSAAADKHGSIIDVPSLFLDNGSEDKMGRVARIMEGVNQTDGGADSEDLDDEEGRLDFG
ncbi:MAG: hypothetical protein AAGG02_16175 [Cyanobacteria bacterium P01_H01_bin.15]